MSGDPSVLHVLTSSFISLVDGGSELSVDMLTGRYHHCWVLRGTVFNQLFPNRSQDHNFSSVNTGFLYESNITLRHNLRKGRRCPLSVLQSDLYYSHCTTCIFSVVIWLSRGETAVTSMAPPALMQGKLPNTFAMLS